MKKKLVMVLMAVMVATAALGGCGQKGATTDSSVSAEEEKDVEIPAKELLKATDYKVEKYVKLNDYMNMSVELSKDYTVSDADIQSYIEYLMSMYPSYEVSDKKTVESGDVVNIDYVGKIDGEEFSGGSATGQHLKIGSGSFIDGFEDGVIGMKTGETKDLNLKFPDSYQSTDLAGKDVVFTVTVNAFTRPAENIDGWELDDAWVAENTDYSTVEEYRAGKRAELEAANETTAENNLQNDAMQQVADGCTFHKIPKSYITLGEEDYDKRYTAYLQNYGISLDDYLEQYADRATYNQEKATYAGTMAKSALLLDAVKEAEGWTTDDQDYQQILNDEAANANMSQEDFLKAANDYYGEDTVVRNIMMERMINMVLDNATVNTVTVDADGNTVE